MLPSLVFLLRSSFFNLFSPSLKTSLKLIMGFYPVSIFLSVFLSRLSCEEAFEEPWSFPLCFSLMNWVFQEKVLLCSSSLWVTPLKPPAVTLVVSRWGNRLEMKTQGIPVMLLQSKKTKKTSLTLILFLASVSISAKVFHVRRSTSILKVFFLGLSIF